MTARVWDDHGITPDPTALCQACGELVWVWIAFEGYGKGFQACESCIRDAGKALDEHGRSHPPQPRTLTLSEVLEGVERASRRTDAWPEWKRALSAAVGEKK